MAERKISIPVLTADPAVIAQQRAEQGQALWDAGVKAGDALIETASDIGEAAIAAGKTAQETITGVEGPQTPPEIKDDYKIVPPPGGCINCQQEAKQRADEKLTGGCNTANENRADRADLGDPSFENPNNGPLGSSNTGGQEPVEIDSTLSFPANEQNPEDLTAENPFMVLWRS